MRSLTILIIIITSFQTNVLGQGNSKENSLFVKTSFALSVGSLKEWRVDDSDYCIPPNKGISNSLSFRGYLNSNWFLEAELHGDIINDAILQETYLAGSYQLSFGRRLFKRNSHSILAGFGIALNQEMIVTYQCLDLGDGLRPENISEQYRATSFFSKMRLEYEHQVTKKWSVGLSATYYYDLIGFGRTDLSGTVRLNVF